MWDYCEIRIERRRDVSGNDEECGNLECTVEECHYIIITSDRPSGCLPRLSVVDHIPKHTVYMSYHIIEIHLSRSGSHVWRHWKYWDRGV